MELKCLSPAPLMPIHQPTVTISTTWVVMLCQTGMEFTTPRLQRKGTILALQQMLLEVVQVNLLLSPLLVSDFGTL